MKNRNTHLSSSGNLCPSDLTRLQTLMIWKELISCHHDWKPQFKSIPTMTSQLLKPKKENLINKRWSDGGSDGQFKPVSVKIFNLQFIHFGLLSYFDVQFTCSPFHNLFM